MYRSDQGTIDPRARRASEGRAGEPAPTPRPRRTSLGVVSLALPSLARFEVALFAGPPRGRLLQEETRLLKTAGSSGSHPQKEEPRHDLGRRLRAGPQEAARDDRPEGD